MAKSVNEDTCLRRTGEIKDALKEIDDKLDTLRTNDLPHIRTEVALLKSRGLGKKEYTIIAGLISIITLLVKYLF